VAVCSCCRLMQCASSPVVLRRFARRHYVNEERVCGAGRALQMRRSTGRAYRYSLWLHPEASELPSSKEPISCDLLTSLSNALTVFCCLVRRLIRLACKTLQEYFCKLNSLEFPSASSQIESYPSFVCFLVRGWARNCEINQYFL